MERRPVVIREDGRLGEIIAGDRLPLAHVPVLVSRVIVGASNELRRWSRVMNAGVVLYVLPFVPKGDIDVEINGISVSFDLNGVNLTITEYTPGTIEADDILTVLYTDTVAGVETVVLENVTTSDGQAVMVGV